MTVNIHPTTDLNRRLFLKGALAGAAGVALASQVPAAEPARKARACILLWMEGGPSQLDTFDLKPDAPAEIRGEFKSIQTKVKGIEICEHLPRLAKLTDKLALIRSMKTTDADHQRGAYHMLTGFSPNADITHPEMGAVIARYRGKPKAELPAFITFGGSILSRAHPGEGYLGPAYQPHRLESPDAAEGNLKKVCDVKQEWKKVGKIYGNTTLGKSCLAARRLVEAGVPFVSVTHGGYDVHSQAFSTLKDRMDELDPAWSGLMEDLNGRGLLDSTLIVWMGEFGRTPKINANNGRDHWVRGWSAVLGGGGIKGGMVHGATDKTGMTVKDKPVSEGDLLATIYTALGIDPLAKNKAGEKEVALTPEKAKPIKELLG